MIGKNTRWWTATLLMFPIVTTFERSKKPCYVYTVINPITDFREALVGSDHLTMYSTVMHGDEVPPPGSDLDIGKQGETYLPTNFLARFGRYRHQRYGHCSPSPGLDPHNNRSIDVYPLKFINTKRFGVETKTLFLVLKARVHELK